MLPFRYVVYKNSINKTEYPSVYWAIDERKVQIGFPFIILEGQWQKLNMNKICFIIKEWKTEELWLGKFTCI